MKIAALDARAREATIRLDGRVVINAVRADDRVGYVDVVRLVNGKTVANAAGDGPVIDRRFGRVCISLHHSTRKRAQLHVASLVRFAGYRSSSSGEHA